MQCGALPPVAVLVEASGQRSNAGTQGDHRHRLQRIDSLLLGEDFAHPGLQMPRGFLKQRQVIEDIGSQQCGQLASWAPAAEYLHHSAQDAVSQDKRRGVGGQWCPGGRWLGCHRPGGGQDVYQTAQHWTLRSLWM